MSKLVIRKRVTLEFLGDEYKEAYIDFKSLPVSDYQKLLKEINDAEKSEDENANLIILRILKDYYYDSRFPNDKGVLEALDDKEELDNFDAEMLIACFGKLTGQDIQGQLAAQQTLAEQGAPQEVIDQVGVEADPKSE